MQRALSLLRVRRASSALARTLIAGVAATFGLAGAAAVADDPAKFTPEQIEFFESKVRPILVEHCQECHGQGDQNANLRVDSRTAMVHGGDSGPAIVPGKPDASLIFKAIKYDSNLQMPPSGKMPPEAIATVTEWIRQGAPWPDEDPAAVAKSPGVATADGIAEARANHWSLRPVGNPPIPAVHDKEWPLTPIDHFVLARLEQEGLRPNPPADKRTLIRRATLDLHGVPPTWEEIQAFESDASPDAYARLIDRLLESPKYGQRWGRYWLDVARYADTKGYVFNEERKYPFAYTYRDYVIRAFNDDLPYDRFIVEQLAADRLDLGDDKRPLAAMGFLTLGRRFLNNQADIIDDRIDVVMRGLQGMTVACARCHDHKFDPIPTADYYSLYGVFASSSEPKDLPSLGAPEQTPEFLAYEKERLKRQGAIDDFTSKKQDEYQTAIRRRVGDYLLAVRTFGDADRREWRGKLDERKLLMKGFERFKRKLASGDAKNDGVFGPWRRFAALPKDLPNDKFAEEAAKLVAELKQQVADGPRINPLVLAKIGEPAPTSFDDLAGRYNQLFVEIDEKWIAAVKAAKEKNEAAPKEFPEKDLEELRQILYGETSPAVIAIDELDTVINRDEKNELRRRQTKLQQLMASSPGAPAHAMVLVENDQPHNPRIFRRGNPGNPGDEVPRAYLQAIVGPERQKFEKGGRLDLARAIADPNNPLTARVFVNRVWMWHFGQGIVRTPSDFGTRSEPPTHPELLDHLARRFMDEGWSVKKLHRWIMLSRVYQQSSEIRPEVFTADVDNKFLARQNRRRLDFESMRDSLLAAAGRLDVHVGGQPVDLVKEPFTTRRTVYGFIDRQNLEGLFRTFDFASPDATNPQRYNTTVPQQALFLMNSPFVVEQARATHAAALAAAGKNGATPDANALARTLFREVLGREPSADELKLVLSYVGDSLAKEDEEEEEDVPTWRYGVARYDDGANRVVDFEPFPHFEGNAWRGGAKMPDDKFAWANLHANGGHPGKNQAHAVVRRWTASRAGVVTVFGRIDHPEENGDGVRARIVHSRHGRLGEWIADHGAADAGVERIEVQDGDVIDFIVDCRESDSFDSFNWAPTVKMIEEAPGVDPAAIAGIVREWAAAGGFTKTTPAKQRPLSPWERLAQTLLISNEFMFVD